MGCLLWLHSLIYILPQSLHWWVLYFVILDRVITAFDCIMRTSRCIVLCCVLCFHCDGKPQVTGGFPHKGPVLRKALPCSNIIMNRWNRLSDHHPRKVIAGYPMSALVHLAKISSSIASKHPSAKIPLHNSSYCGWYGGNQMFGNWVNFLPW